MTRRKALYDRLSCELSSFNDIELQNLLNQSVLQSKSLGGKTGLVTIDGKQVFYKIIPLAGSEMSKENKFSTANFFNLPQYFQYGLGSLGFGAWREHKILYQTSDWVLKEDIGNFPIVYHSRIMPASCGETCEEAYNETEKYIKMWPNNAEIKSLFEVLILFILAILLFFT